jgi:cell division protein ZapA
MGQINVLVGGRTYTLACRDGEEDRLLRLSAHINRKSEELRSSLGQMSEPRMLLMAALLVSDELFDLRERMAKTAPPGLDVGMANKALTTAAERIDALAANL